MLIDSLMIQMLTLASFDKSLVAKLIATHKSDPRSHQDSILGCTDTREFVVYDTSQIYPEYIMLLVKAIVHSYVLLISCCKCMLREVDWSLAFEVLQRIQQACLNQCEPSAEKENAHDCKQLCKISDKHKFVVR